MKRGCACKTRSRSSRAETRASARRFVWRWRAKERKSSSTITATKRRRTALVREIQSFGGTACEIGLDVSKPEDVQRLVAAAVERYGKLDIMVNNAGIEDERPFLEMTLENYLEDDRGESHRHLDRLSSGRAANGGARARRTHHQHLVHSRRNHDADERRVLREQRRDPHADAHHRRRIGRVRHHGK